MLVAVVGQRDALDQLHDEEGPPGLGRAGVEHLGDVRVVHQGQGLSLRLEPRQHRPRVHSLLDQLERHLPPHRLGLLGEVDAFPSAFADLLAELVPTGDDAADQRAQGACWTIAGRWAGRGMWACGLRRLVAAWTPAGGHHRALFRLPGAPRGIVFSSTMFDSHIGDIRRVEVGRCF